MLRPSEYDHLCDQLITLYDDLDRSIIDDMTRRMMRMGYVSETTRWQAEMLQQSGMLYEDILSEIARRTDATENQVRALFEDAGVQSIRNDNRSYRAAGLEGIVKMSDSALQTLNAGYVKCQGDLSNLTLTTANTAQQAYITACNLAYMQVTSGTMDYGTAIRRAVQNTASEGSWVLYPSGHRDRLDVAVRRSVLTGVGQTVRQLSFINAKDTGCDLMEITAHAGARPSHADWQGKIVSLSGRRGYLSLKDIGYGTGDGFGGWNCRHDWFPFFEGISERAYTDKRLKELNARNIDIDGKKYTEYEVSQMQRALERRVREMKRRVSAADTMVRESKDDTEANANRAFFNRESVKLKKAEQKLSDFLGKTGNLPDNNRTWVNGFGRSTAQKAVHANKKVQQALQNSSGKSGGNPAKNNQNKVDKSNKNDIIRLEDMFHTEDDPMREVMGSAYDNNRDELFAIIDELESMGVEVDISDTNRSMGYQPSVSFEGGSPGRIKMDREASISAWIHESQHAKDDKATGWHGMDILMNNPEERYQWEVRAYQKEIELAEKIGRDDIAERLKQLLEKERRAIFNEE